jgi:hypothetical protein
LLAVSNLDLVGSPPLQKRSKFSSIGSPNLVLPPQPSSLLGSPAVGEFKGWFSNLFHWKVQSHVLYSVEDVASTRNELLRILESFGVAVIEESEWGGVLKCRVEDVYDGHSQVQKHMRFRVEVSPTSGYLQSGGTPRLSSHNPLSPPLGSVRARTHLEQLHGFETIAALVLEKGSLTTFKLACQRVKGEWRLDGSGVQSVLSPMVIDDGGLDQRVGTC